jgi:hypothetical protein
MRLAYSMAVTLLLLLGLDPAFAGWTHAATALTWLEKAVREERCPASPVNVPASVLRASGGALARRVSLVDGTLVIEGTADPDHIVLKRANADGVRVVWNDRKLGPFGPLVQVLVRAGEGDDVVIMASDVGVPARIEGGGGHDCLQGGGAPILLFGREGDDVLIAGTGRPALHSGPGANRIIVPRRMGEVRVGPGADGDVLKALGPLYTTRRLGTGSSSHSGHGASITPIILGAADVADGRIAPLLQEAYAAGQAVVLTNATAADAERLRARLGHPNAAEMPGSQRPVPLTFVRRAPRPGTLANDFSTGVFAHALTTSAHSRPRGPDERTIELLSRVFSATGIVPEGPADTPSNDLLQLANSYTSSAVAQDDSGDQVELTNSVWNVRSFQNQSDFYYVRQEATYVWGAGQTNFPMSDNTAISWLTPIQVNPTLVQTSPGSTQCSESTTSEVDWNIGGSAGWNYQQVANATLTGGVSVSNSETITCPTITIVNQSDPSTGNPEWLYTIPGPNSPPQATTFSNQWIWQVPFSGYQAGQTQITVASEARSTFYGGFSPCTPFQDCPTFGTPLSSVVPLPFGDTFALQQPSVSSVNPTCANAGTQFVISGTGFYPSLVQSVVIGGTALDSSQYTTTSDTAITVIAPEMSGAALSVVVETSQGQSNSNVTIEISDIDFCDL